MQISGDARSQVPKAFPCYQGSKRKHQLDGELQVFIVTVISQKISEELKCQVTSLFHVLVLSTFLQFLKMCSCNRREGECYSLNTAGHCHLREKNANQNRSETETKSDYHKDRAETLNE